MLYLASDHAGYALKNRVIALCKEHSIPVKDVYPVLDLKDDYPDVAEMLAQKIKQEGEGARGIAICGTAEGICMALNRFSYIRAATVDSPFITSLVRRHNQANVLCLPGPYAKKTLSDSVIIEILHTFIHTSPDQDERHLRRVDKLGQLPS